MISINPKVQTLSFTSRKHKTASRPSENSNNITFAGKTIDKTTAIVGGIGILAATAAIAATAVHFIKKGGATPKAAKAMAEKANEFAKTANAVAQEADSLSQKVNEKVSSVRDLFEKLKGLEEGTVVDNAKLTLISETEGHTKKALEQFAGDNKNTVRRSTFVDGILETIEEYFADGKTNLFTFKDGKLSGYQEGIEYLEGGSRNIAKELLLKDGALSAYMEGVERLTGDGMTAAKRIDFFPNPTSYWYKEGFSLKGGKEAFDKTIDIVNDKIAIYTENSIDKTKSTVSTLKFEEGKPASFVLEETPSKEGSKTQKSEVVCKDGKWAKPKNN